MPSVLNYKSIENFVSNLGLKYEWVSPKQGSRKIIVEKIIEYCPSSCWLKNTEKNVSIHSKTLEEFQKMCLEIAKK